MTALARQVASLANGDRRILRTGLHHELVLSSPQAGRSVLRPPTLSGGRLGARPTVRREDRDLDFATDARPEEVRARVEVWADSVWLVGEKFGTVGVMFEGVKVEITTFRSDVMTSSLASRMSLSATTSTTTSPAAISPSMRWHERARKRTARSLRRPRRTWRNGWCASWASRRSGSWMTRCACCAGCASARNLLRARPRLGGRDREPGRGNPPHLLGTHSRRTGRNSHVAAAQGGNATVVGSGAGALRHAGT